MKRARSFWQVLALAAGLLVFTVEPVLACATCFGKSDSALAKGMNMGIFTLLAFIGAVLAGVVGFFIFLARRSARVQAQAGRTNFTELANRS